MRVRSLDHWRNRSGSRLMLHMVAFWRTMRTGALGRRLERDFGVEGRTRRRSGKALGSPTMSTQCRPLHDAEPEMRVASHLSIVGIHAATSAPRYRPSA